MTPFKIAPAFVAAVLTLSLAATLRSEARNNSRKRSAEAACKWARAQLGREVQPCSTKGCLYNSSSAGEKACTTPSPKPDADDRKLDLVAADGHVRWYFYCARFVRMAYAQDAKFATASIFYDAVKDHVTKSEDIPTGALVFWEWKEYGHVGIYVGNGKVLHTGANGKTKQKGIRSSPLQDITEVLGEDSFQGWVDPTGEPLEWSR